MCRIVPKLAALAAAVALAGCASLPPGLQGFEANAPGTYTPGQTQNVQRVRIGTVIAVRFIEIQPSTVARSVSSAGGAALGGLLGHQIGGGRGKAIATVAGAIGGAVGGNLIGSHLQRQPGEQITVKLDHDRYDYGQAQIIDVTQATGPVFTVGERVQVIGTDYSGQPVRVEPLADTTESAR